MLKRFKRCWILFRAFLTGHITWREMLFELFWPSPPPSWSRIHAR